MILRIFIFLFLNFLFTAYTMRTSFKHTIQFVTDDTITFFNINFFFYRILSLFYFVNEIVVLYVRHNFGRKSKVDFVLNPHILWNTRPLILNIHWLLPIFQTNVVHRFVDQFVFNIDFSRSLQKCTLSFIVLYCG